MLFLTAIAAFDRLFEALARMQAGTAHGEKKEQPADKNRLIIARVVKA
jgi:hypothetical protein